MGKRLTWIAALLLLAVACGDDSSPTTTSTQVTTSSSTVVTSSPPVTEGATNGQTSSTVGAATTSTTVPAFSLPEFTVVERTDDNVLVVAVPPAIYTDIDIRNLVDEVVERYAPVVGLHIIDDESIAELVLAETVTAEEQAMLDEHYFLRLEEGFRMVFVGPFADVGEVILGS